MKDAIIKLFNGEEKRRAKEIKSIVSDFVFNLPPNCLSVNFREENPSFQQRGVW